MKSNYKHPLYLAISLALTALTPLSAHALDLHGYTTANDAACWTDPSCSLPRGGDSDVMTVYNPNGTIFQQIFAFGNEELNNIYYFDPASVPVDSSQFGNYTSLYEANGDYSDTFGIATLGGNLVVLAFSSDPQSTLYPNAGISFIETAGAVNPVPENDPYLTTPYNATFYLSPDMQAAGYTATFQSDVPEASDLLLLSAGLLGLGIMRRRRSASATDQLPA